VKLTKRIEMCNECGSGYYKPFWEPLWFARRAWADAHEIAHSDPENHRAVRLYREWERERILELLTNWTGVGDYPDGYRDALKAAIRQIKEMEEQHD